MLHYMYHTVPYNELGNRLECQGYHLALEPVTQRNHLLEGRAADGPRALKFEFMAPKI